MKILMIGFLLVVVQCAMGQHFVVRVENIKDDRGQIGVAIYSSEKDYMKKRFAGKFVPAKKGTVEIIFENLPTDFYAVTVMHDSNSNEKLDTNLIGIPKEGYGFSNNVKGTFGPPSFDQAKFKLGGEVVIKMLY
ncbi:MAG: DUF2141 domain-containing protein [Flammeovirgaceae bacterium]